MIDLWWSEAEKNDVLPIQGTMGQRLQFPKPTVAAPRTTFTYFPGAPVPLLVQPQPYNKSHTITAEIHVPDGGCEGVIYASGAHTGGYSLFVKDGKLHFAYNYLARKMYRIDDSNALPTGDVTVLYEFEVTGKPELRSGKGAPGTGKLFVDGNQVGSVDMDVTVPFLFSAEGLSVGSDYGDSVDHDNYRTTFPFTGTVKRVTFDLSEDALDDAEKLLRTEATTRHDLSKQ
jgi:arylsulfatase